SRNAARTRLRRSALATRHGCDGVPYACLESGSRNAQARGGHRAFSNAHLQGGRDGCSSSEGDGREKDSHREVADHRESAIPQEVLWNVLSYFHWIE
ncbi:hypothetical protein PENTCL1PPCAC_545, partial [Pristionchus entomophagus]